MLLLVVGHSNGREASLRFLKILPKPSLFAAKTPPIFITAANGE
jgi:hypothetical protein